MGPNRVFQLAAHPHTSIELVQIYWYLYELIYRPSSLWILQQKIDSGRRENPDLPNIRALSSSESPYGSDFSWVNLRSPQISLTPATVGNLSTMW